jgi:hypothetical protein
MGQSASFTPRIVTLDAISTGVKRIMMRTDEINENGRAWLVRRQARDQSPANHAASPQVPPQSTARFLPPDC